MKITLLRDKIKSILNHTTLLALARRLGFIKRQRRLSPFHLICALIQTLGSQPRANLADIYRTYGNMTNTIKHYKSFYNQLKKNELTSMMRSCVNQASQLWLLDPFKEALPDTYPFKQIHLHDGSSLKLHPALAETFPGRFTKTTPAAIELHLTLDLLAGTANYAEIDADKESEHPYAPHSHELKGVLLMMDAGYFTISYGHDVDKNGGFYLIRTKNNITPTICEAFDEKGNKIKALKDKPLQSLPLQSGQLVDLTVQWKKRPGTYRLIAFWDKRHKRRGFLITNLSREQFSAQKVSELYGLRWQIELFFKELKSYCNLSTFETRDEHIVRTLVWSSLLVLLLKRYLAFGTGLLRNIFISTQKVARCSPSWLPMLLSALSDPEHLLFTLEKIVDFLAVHGGRANLKRDQETLLLSLGMGIYPDREFI